MRGKGSIAAPYTYHGRITPAYAGKRALANAATNSTRDHPRLCGEKNCQKHLAWKSTGSPPPMRGKGDGGMTIHGELGITPAYAGKRKMNQRYYTWC